MREKLFIAYAPQQGAGALKLSEYIPQGNSRLQYGQTRFPIIPVINGYAQSGDSIRVLLVIQDKDECRYNAELFRNELQALCADKGVTYAVEEIASPYDDCVSTHIDTFQKLVDRIGDHCDVHACITYGSKPSPMVELMALRYARCIRKDTAIACVVYGQFDHTENRSKIYDETALAQLDDIMAVLSSSGCSDPAAQLRRILSL